MPRHILTVDLGFGDAGKGSVVDALCRHHKIDTVVRYSGGPQCAHNVITPEGIHHTFSQFGSGTLAGARTILTEDVVVDPIRLINEGLALQKKGVANVFDKIAVHRDCLVITPFHRALNHLRELYRGNARHGSCGVGVWETVDHARKHPDHALTIKHLSYPDIGDRLAVIKGDLNKELNKLRSAWEYEAVSIFNDPNLFDAFCWKYHTFNKVMIGPVYDGYIESALQQNDTVFEGAQGVLIDENYGFFPYVTGTDVTLANAIKTLAEAGITDYETIGILRAYGCRHGPGPFPTEYAPLARTVKEQHNRFNEWQRDFRVGWFDMRMARYAINVAGRIDRLAITHLDKIEKRHNWKIGVGYNTVGWLDKLNPTDIEERKQITNRLMKVKPEDVCYNTYHNSEVSIEICKQLGIEAGVLSFGPTAADIILY